VFEIFDKIHFIVFLPVLSKFLVIIRKKFSCLRFSYFEAFC